VCVCVHFFGSYYIRIDTTHKRTDSALNWTRYFFLSTSI
jgi:hypothetical protein